MDENIDSIINKFVKYKFNKSELEEIAPLIGSEEFNTHFELIQDINTLMQDEGRKELKKEIQDILEREKQTEKKGQIIRLKEYRLQAVAACFLIACAVGIIKSTTGYNNESKFRKSYIERYEG
jgi:hypothetical protein